MFVTVLAGVFAATIVTGSPEAGAEASTTANAELAKPAAVVAKKDKLVCRSVRVTGTRMADRVCASREQWDERERQAKKKTEKLQAGEQWRQNNNLPAKIEMPSPAG